MRVSLYVVYPRRKIKFLILICEQHLSCLSLCGGLYSLLEYLIWNWWWSSIVYFLHLHFHCKPINTSFIVKAVINSVFLDGITCNYSFSVGVQMSLTTPYICEVSMKICMHVAVLL